MSAAPRLVLLTLIGAAAIAPSSLARGADASLTVSLIKMPYRQDRDGRSRQAANNLILGALKGVQQRGGIR